MYVFSCQRKIGSAYIDILRAVKALVLSELIVIFHPGDGKS